MSSTTIPGTVEEIDARIDQIDEVLADLNHDYDGAALRAVQLADERDVLTAARRRLALPPQLRDRMLALLEGRYDLVYVSQGDQFGGEQLAEMFKTGENAASFDSWESDCRYEAAEREVRELARRVLDPDEHDLLHGTEAWAEVREAILDRDESDAFADMLRATPDQLLRYRIGGGEDEQDLDAYSWTWDEARVNAEARRLGEMIGADFTYLPLLRELVVEASYGGVLYVIWTGPVDDLLTIALGDQDVERTLTWGSSCPEVLVLDRTNGSGHSVTFPGLTITAPWDRDRLVLDRHDWGYGWDKVCGLVGGAFRNTVTVTPPVAR